MQLNDTVYFDYRLAKILYLDKKHGEVTIQILTTGKKYNLCLDRVEPFSKEKIHVLHSSP